MDQQFKQGYRMHCVLSNLNHLDVDWWSPEPGDDWEPVERGEFDDVDEPADISHLA